MKLNSKQLESYIKNGFLVVENVFLSNELETICQAMNQVIEDYRANSASVEGLVLEDDKTSIRTINGVHLKYEIFKELCCHPKLLLPSRQLVKDNNLYVHQFKINLKEAFTGDIWAWHQDYIYWLKGDGMPKARAVSVAILLDDVMEFNGPLMFIPQSHKFGIIDFKLITESDESDWTSNVAVKLKYTASQVAVTKLVNDFGIVVPKAQKGSILFFDSNILHASGSNLSPFSRRFVLITYNPVNNVEVNHSGLRPTFLASRDFTPISVGEENLLQKYKR